MAQRPSCLPEVQVRGDQRRGAGAHALTLLRDPRPGGGLLGPGFGFCLLKTRQLFGLWPSIARQLFGKNVQGMRPLQTANSSGMGLPGLVNRAPSHPRGPLMLPLASSQPRGQGDMPPRCWGPGQRRCRFSQQPHARHQEEGAFDLLTGRPWVCVLGGSPWDWQSPYLEVGGSLTGMERLFDYDMSLVTFTVSVNPTGGHFMNKLKRMCQVQCSNSVRSPNRSKPA